MTFSPDGTRIASGSRDKTIRLWDVEVEKLLATLHGHQSGVSSVAFSPDGKRIVSGSIDGSLRVWESELSSAREMWHAAAQRLGEAGETVPAEPAEEWER